MKQPKEVHIRTYNKKECAVFWKTKERYGALSNMASGFPLLINNTNIHSSEALYQCCKFPDYSDLQKKIISQETPLLAKKVCRNFSGKERRDWLLIRTQVMRWCLKVKLIQNWSTFSKKILETDNLQIVEYSNKDDFWGALPWDKETLQGRNVLGRLLMELREQLRANPYIERWDISPPEINNFNFLNEPIRTPKMQNGSEKDLFDKN